MKRQQVKALWLIFFIGLAASSWSSCNSRAKPENYRYGLITYDSLENKVHFTGLRHLMDTTEVTPGAIVNLGGWLLAQRNNYYYVMDADHQLLLRYRVKASGLELNGSINMKDIPWEPYMSWVTHVNERMLLLGSVNNNKFNYIEIDLEKMVVQRLGELSPPPAPKDKFYVGVSAELVNDDLVVQYTFQKGLMRQHIVPCDDTLYAARFSYPEMKLKDVTKDSRTSWPGSYTILAPASLVYKGDIYSLGQPGGRTGNHTALPSAVLKLDPATNTFDPDYYLEVARPASAEAYTLHDLGHGMALSSVVDLSKVHSFRNYMVNRVARYELLDLEKQKKIKLDLPPVPLEWIINTLQEGDKAYISVYQENGKSQIWQYDHQSGKLSKGISIKGTILHIDHL